MARLQVDTTLGDPGYGNRYPTEMLQSRWSKRFSIRTLLYVTAGAAVVACFVPYIQAERRRAREFRRRMEFGQHSGWHGVGCPYCEPDLIDIVADRSDLSDPNLRSWFISQVRPSDHYQAEMIAALKTAVRDPNVRVREEAARGLDRVLARSD